MAELLTNFRAKYGSAYDDLSDQELAEKIVTKWPGAYDEELAPLLSSVPEQKPKLAIEGELKPAEAEVNKSLSSIDTTTRMLAKEAARPVVQTRPSGAIGTTGVVVDEPPPGTRMPGDMQQLKDQVGAAETLQDLQQIVNAEGATMQNVMESQVLSNQTGRPVDYKAIPPPLSEESIEPGLLQKTVDYLTRPLSAIVGAEKAAIKREDVGQAVRDALTGRVKTFSESALEALGLPEGPPLVDIEGSLGFGAGAPSPLKTTLAKVTRRGAAGMALDVAQDPTTYLSLGTGRGLKLTSGVILNKVGEKALADEIAHNVANGMARDEARAAAEQAVTQAARGGATHLIDRGGIKFAGRTVPGTDAVQQAARDTLQRAALAVQSTEPGARLVQAAKQVGSLFDRDIMVRQFEPYVRDKQRYLNLTRADREDVIDAATVMFKGTSPAEREAVTHAIEHRSMNNGAFLDKSGNPLEPRLEAVALRVDNAQTQLRQREAALGLGDSFVDDYMMHAYTNYPKVNTGAVGAAVSPNMRANLERVLPTLEQAKTLGLKPVSEDAMDLFILRHVASSRAQRAKELIEATGTKFGKQGLPLPQRIAQNLVEAPHFRNAAGEAIYIPREIAEDIGTLEASKAGRLLRGYDRMQNLWKSSVTSPWPAFHIRNATTNVVNAGLDIGAQALNPIRHHEAIQVLRGMPGDLVTQTGERYSYDELLRSFRVQGLEGAYAGKLDLALTPTQRPRGIVATRLGSVAGTFIENQGRMLHYLASIRRGMTPEVAAERTKKFLFDYGNLSKFEHDIMRRVFPFYTFYRKNVPLQLRATLTEPGRQAIIAKAFATPGDQERIERERRLWPDYVSSGLAIEVGKDQQGNPLLLWGTGLPIEDLGRIVPQRRETTGLGGEVVRKNFLAMLNPLARFVIEEVTNKDLFLDRPLNEVNKVYDAYGPVIDRLPKPVKDYLDFQKEYTRRGDIRYTMDPQKLHLIRSFILSRLYSTVGKQFDTRKDRGTRWLNNATGLRIGSLDSETQVYPALKERASEREKATAAELTQQKRAVLFEPKPATPEELKWLRSVFSDDQLRQEGLLK